MTSKRLTALIIVLPLLYLNLVRADSACASHYGEDVAPVASAGEHAHHASEAPSQEEESCDAPASLDCCQAVTSCSVVLGSYSDASGAAPVTVHQTIDASFSDLPVSAIGSPEPPPPRA